MPRPHRDGTPAKKRECGVFIAARNDFCHCPQKWLGRCEFHLAALKQDSLYLMLKNAKSAERRRMLAGLDALQKVRPPWSYEGDEESLAAMTAQNEETL
jgi:hypothetical protein